MLHICAAKASTCQQNLRKQHATLLLCQSPYLSTHSRADSQGMHLTCSVREFACQQTAGRQPRRVLRWHCQTISLSTDSKQIARHASQQQCQGVHLSTDNRQAAKACSTAAVLNSLRVNRQHADSQSRMPSSSVRVFTCQQIIGKRPRHAAQQQYQDAACPGHDS